VILLGFLKWILNILLGFEGVVHLFQKPESVTKFTWRGLQKIILVMIEYIVCVCVCVCVCV